MNLDEALYRGITGRSPLTEGRSTASMVEELRGAFGVKPPEGISERTWRRLRHDPGGKYAPKTTDALRRAQRRSRLSAGREKMLRGRPIIGLHAMIRVSDDLRERKILVSNWSSPSTGTAAGDSTGLMRRVLDRWLQGDDRGAAEVFRQAAENGLTGSAPVGRRLEIVDTFAVKLWAPTPENGSAALMWQRT